MAASVHKTLKAAFRGVRIHGNGDGALFYVATDRTPVEFLHPPSLEEIHPYVTESARKPMRASLIPSPSMAAC